MLHVVTEMIRYGIIGGTSTAVDAGGYLIGTRLLDLHALNANALAYLSGHLVSFFGNRFFTFRAHGHGPAFAQYKRFWIVSLVGLVIAQMVLATGLALGFHDLYAKAISILLSGLWNYTGNRQWTFRKIQN